MRIDRSNKLENDYKKDKDIPPTYRRKREMIGIGV